ncbi:cell division protein ZapE [Hyphomicrobium sulfonivorans]|uniref:cell division protein ZapE n=1 Tax=Hyphomicrobium sulfonivorans TaxID=121290 RepID=UPI00156E5ADE|nr:cell division protein ZapE [Hyphomicrobium sulfonivorans]MBI1648445.1 AFG1 family ATPase [Hyphomicrobium sulfonivorans]NSL71019.1 cell division protein ZapE [Hyphomicrobium sulfonivorans]
MTAFPLEQLQAKVRAGLLEADPAQLAVAELLDRLARQLRDWKPERRGPLAFLRRGKQASPPRGLYVHGEVGRGKTMLMDLFYNSVSFAPKRRSHFHEFMADVHERIAVARRTHPGDPMPVVAESIVSEARLLCFDELQVTDIADAMILGRLFEHLFASGIVVVATSNSTPATLYERGLNRQLFLPFIASVEAHMDVAELQSARDYRLERLAGLPLYFCPADDRASAELDAHWDRLTGHQCGCAETLDVKGRQLRVPQAAMGIARFSFHDLCEAPLGTVDYLRLAHTYHTVVVDGIPRLDRDRREVSRRFINLIDTLYDNKVCLIASAAAEPEALCEDPVTAKVFERTVSRLMEMRSADYVASRGATRDGDGIAAGQAEG